MWEGTVPILTEGCLKFCLPYVGVNLTASMHATLVLRVTVNQLISISSDLCLKNSRHLQFPYDGVHWYSRFLFDGLESMIMGSDTVESFDYMLSRMR